MRLNIELVNDGEVDELVIMHYRAPKEDEAPELVAQYPFNVAVHTGALLTDVLSGDMLVIA